MTDCWSVHTCMLCIARARTVDTRWQPTSQRNTMLPPLSVRDDVRIPRCHAVLVFRLPLVPLSLARLERMARALCFSELFGATRQRRGVRHRLSLRLQQNHSSPLSTSSVPIHHSTHACSYAKRLVYNLKMRVGMISSCCTISKS